MKNFVCLIIGHFYNKPIVSMYVGFHTRHIIFECRCGKRKAKYEHKSFSQPFSIETTCFLSKTEFDKILNKQS